MTSQQVHLYHQILAQRNDGMAVVAAAEAEMTELVMSIWEEHGVGSRPDPQKGWGLNIVKDGEDGVALQFVPPTPVDAPPKESRDPAPPREGPPLDKVDGFGN